VALLIVLIAFEWKFPDNSISVKSDVITEDYEELMEIPITNQPPPPPPKITQPVIIEVPDEEEIEEEIEIDLDVEIDEEEVIEEILVTEEEIEEETTDEIFTIVEEKATYKGGDELLYKYVSTNLKYPEAARRMAVEGRVFVSFVVEAMKKLSEF
jgi:protein TonB